MRPAFSALWNIDLAFADIVATSSDQRLGAIRMAWWRERLDELDAGKVAPAEPRLQAVAAELLPRGLTGHQLSHLEDAWLPLLHSSDREAVVEGLQLRGRVLFGAGAKLLGGEPGDAEAAGALWSLVDGARHSADVHYRMFLLDRAKQAISELPRNRPPKYMRRLTGLAAIAAHDVLRNRPLDLARGDPGRAFAAFIHYLRGVLPRG